MRDRQQCEGRGTGPQKSVRDSEDLNTYKERGKTGSWASFIALCYIWKILVIILHFIIGLPAKPEDHKKNHKNHKSQCSLVSHWTKEEGGKCFAK